MKNLIFTLAIVLTALFATDTQAQDEMFARGSFNGWNIDHKMVWQNGVWEAKSVFMTTGDHEMKFADTEDWTGDDWGGGEGLADTVILTTGGGPETTFSIEQEGYYNITFDTVDRYYEISYTEVTANHEIMFARGDYNGWNLDNRMYLADDNLWMTYPITMTAGDYEMKFANSGDWTGDDWGNSTGLSGTVELTTGGGPNLAYTITQPGDYLISFNDETLAYEIFPAATNTNEILDNPESFRVYPNPASSRASITNENRTKIHSIEIYSLSGNRLSKRKVQSDAVEVHLNTQALTSQICILKINTENRTIYKRLVVKH